MLLTWLHEHGEDGRTNHRHHTTYHNGKATHRTLDGTHLHRLRRTQRMGRTSDGDTFGYRFLDAEQLEEFLCKDIAQDTRYDDNYYSYGNMTSQLLRNTDTDGGGDRLRQEGDISRMVEMEEQSQNQDRTETCQHTRQDTNQYSTIILLE